MTYATGKETLKKKCEGISKEIQANSSADLDFKEVTNQIMHWKINIKPKLKKK